MAQAQRTYNPVSRTNFDQDLATITIPSVITRVNFVGITINSSNGSVLTFTDPVNQHITVILYKSVDGGANYNEFCGFQANGGAVDKHGTRVDPSILFQLDPPLLPGTIVKPHVTQVGTFWLGGQLTADYTP